METKQRFIALVAFSVLCATAAAQPYPIKPVRIIVGFPPGSTPDIVTRIAAESMSADLDQPLIIENRPGAGGIIATEAVVRAQPDGHTLIVSGCSADGIVYAFVMINRQPFDPFEDLPPWAA